MGFTCILWYHSYFFIAFHMFFYLHFLKNILGTQNIKIERDSTGDTDKRKTLERGNIIAEVQNTDTSIERSAG